MNGLVVPNGICRFILKCRLVNSPDFIYSIQQVLGSRVVVRKLLVAQKITKRIPSQDIKPE